MPKYTIALKEIEIYHIEIEARSEEEAKEQAWEIFDGISEEEKFNYHNDSDGEAEIIEEVEE